MFNLHRMKRGKEGATEAGKISKLMDRYLDFLLEKDKFIFWEPKACFLTGWSGLVELTVVKKELNKSSKFSLAESEKHT
jgi:glycogen debranching enzyme